MPESVLLDVSCGIRRSLGTASIEIQEELLLV